MGRSQRRREWHAQQLIEIAQNIGRPLTLVIRTGSESLPRLASAFKRVVYLDTSAHMKAKKRQEAHWSGGKLSRESSPTATGEPIDELFLANIRACQRATRSVLSRKHADDVRGAQVLVV